MTQLPRWAEEALSEVYDPCCEERGISVVDMGLLRSVTVAGGRVRVELMLTSGWCPFASRVLTDIRDRIAAVPGIAEAEVEIVWDEAWTSDRLSPGAWRKLRFLPAPSAIADRDAYVATHSPLKEDQA